MRMASTVSDGPVIAADCCLPLCVTLAVELASSRSTISSLSVAELLMSNRKADVRDWQNMSQRCMSAP